MISFNKISEIIEYVSKNTRIYVYDAKSFPSAYRAELHSRGRMFSDNINKASSILVYINDTFAMDDFIAFSQHCNNSLPENMIIWVENISDEQFGSFEKTILSKFYFKHPLYHLLDSVIDLGEIVTRICVYSRKSNVTLFEQNLCDIGRMNDYISNIKCLSVSMALDYVRIGDFVLNYNASFGYESYVLGYSPACLTYGVIKNHEEISYADEMYSSKNVKFISCNIIDRINSDNRFDYIYARFEKDDYCNIEYLLKRFHTLLIPSGRLMLLLLRTENEKSFEAAVKLAYYFLCEYFALEWCWDFRVVEGHICVNKHNCMDDIDKSVCDAVLFMGMKNPLYGTECDYVETTWKDEKGLADFINFQKFYKNPYLIKGFQAYGKIENVVLRNKIANYILKIYAPKGVEYGGALCYLGYRLLEENNNIIGAVDTIKARIIDYLEIKVENPHILRWKISLCYMLGNLLLKEERYDESIIWFKKCISYDALEFSPSLGTKIFGAYNKLGCLSESIEERHKWYREALSLVPKYFAESGWRDVVSNFETPIPTGFEDMSTILECCKNMAWDLMYGGNTYNSRYMRTGNTMKLVEDKMDFEQECNGLKTEIKVLKDEIKMLKEENRNLDFMNQHLREENIHILSSRSWKVTKPFRYLGKYVKSFKSVGQNDILFDKVCNLIKNNRHRSICIFSPMYDSENLKDGYYRRVHEVDEILWDFIKIHINDINFINDRLRIEFFENDVINISYNPANVVQLKKVKQILRLAGKMYTHSLWQMKDWALNMDGVLKVLDIHGAQPEESMLYGDIEGAKKVAEKECMAVQKVNYMISVTHSMKKHMIRKYGSLIKAEFILMPIYENRLFANQDLSIKPLVDGHPIVVYAGGTQKWQMIPEMQSAMYNTKNDVFFEICVPIPEDFMRIWDSKVKLLTNMNVESRSHEDVIKLYDRCHYGFVLRDDIVVNNVACPTKLIEYIEHDVVPILSTTHIGDFCAMGMEYILVDDFVEGTLPEEDVRAKMAMNNRKILELFKQEYKKGREKLIEVMESDEFTKN